MTEPRINKVGISEENLAELIFGQVTDGRTMCRLSQVSLKFSKVVKRKLIKYEKNVEDCKIIWTEMNGEKHGLHKEWNSDGKIVGVYGFINGTKTGIQKAWCQNMHLLFETAWSDKRGRNLCIGLILSKYSRCEHNCVKDKKNGLCKGWYSTGQIMYECNFLQDVRHGEYKWWDQEGQLVIDEYYINDILIQIENKNN